MRFTRRASAIYVLFFLSGAAGLVYQVAWSRLLNEVFGVTVYAITAVLATFLGGLALGGWLLGPVADRTRSPLRAYGLLELGVALAALVGSWSVRAYEPIHVWAASRFAPDSVALLVSRCALAALVVVPPTFLMGGTLPAVTRAVVAEIREVGRELGLLYALNTAGAVVGSVLTGFVLIRALGLHPTLWLAVACNAVVGVAALWLAARPGSAPAPAPTEGLGAVPGNAPGTSPNHWLLVCIALSGVASLALEVIWTRMLILVVGTSTYAFVTMLSAFLVGIALGSAVVRAFIDRVRDPRKVFGWVQAAIAAATAASLPVLRVVINANWVERPGFGWIEAMAGRFGVSFAVMLVPTTLMGMTLPLAVKIFARGVDTLGARLGRVLGANTAGNILGAVLGGFVLLPLLGMQRSIAVLAMLNLAAASWALLPWDGGFRSWRVLTRAAPASAALWSCIALLVMWHPDPLPRTGGTEEDAVRFYREGRSATVKVIQSAVDAKQMLMSIDGVVIGQSSAGVDKKQQVLAHFPFLLQERTPARVLTIGLGTGILAGELAKHPGVDRVEVVEISRGVIEGARLFDRWNSGALHDPRVTVIEDDGVNYLKRARGLYDAIVSDGKSKSGHAGNAVFFSEDYYESARAHLTPDGSMFQWVPLELPGADLRTIVRTFREVFPHTYLWISQESAFLVGRQRPLSLDLARMQRILDAPESADLRRYGWNRAAEVAGFLVADQRTIGSWLGPDVPVNSLERPVLEFYSPGGLATPERDRVAANMTELVALRRFAKPDVARGAGPEVDVAFESAAHLVEGVAALAHGDMRGIGEIEGALSRTSQEGLVRHWAAEALFNVALNLDLDGRTAEASSLYRQAVNAWPAFSEAWINLGRDLALQGRTGEAMEYLRRAIELNPESGSARRQFSELLLASGQVPAAAEEARSAVQLAPRSASAHAALGLALALGGNTDAGVAEFIEASHLRPDWPVPLARAALLLATRQGGSARDHDEATRLALRALELAGPRDVTVLETLAATQAAAGRFGDAAATEERALDVAAGAGDARLAEAARALVDRYRHGLPLEPVATQPR